MNKIFISFILGIIFITTAQASDENRRSTMSCYTNQVNDRYIATSNIPDTNFILTRSKMTPNLIDVKYVPRLVYGKKPLPVRFESDYSRYTFNVDYPYLQFEGGTFVIDKFTGKFNQYTLPDTYGKIYWLGNGSCSEHEKPYIE